jgi:hypothetical protein
MMFSRALFRLRPVVTEAILVEAMILYRFERGKEKYET